MTAAVVETSAPTIFSTIRSASRPVRLYSKEQLHLGLSARRTGGGQRDQGSPVGESPSLEDGPGAGLSYVVPRQSPDRARQSLGVAMLRDPNVSGGVMPGRRAQRICQGGTSGPSSIAMRNVSERDKDGDTSDTLRTHTGTTHVRTYMHMGSSVPFTSVCVDPQLSPPPDKHSWMVLGCMSVGTHTCDSITEDSRLDCSAPSAGAPLSGPG